MTIVTARITVAPDGTISGHAPAAVPAGEHQASITVGILEPPLADTPFDINDLPVHDLGPWPEGFSVRREEIYDDDGR
jgi:hypothetical protein